MHRCIICDDEPPARELIASYVERVDNLELVAQCENALEAFSLLQKQHIDLLFLDIRMPRMSGMELIRSLADPPRVILITAYKDFAAEGFDLDVVDYLVKPVTFERFLRALAKYHRIAPTPGQPGKAGQHYEEAYLFIKVDKEQVKLYFKNILYVEGLGDYIRIHTGEGSYVSYNRLAYMEELLPESRFSRIHKSYIVSLAALNSVSGDRVRIAGQELPLGRVYKPAFQDALAKFERAARKLD